MKYYYLEKKNCNPPNHTFSCILSLAAYYLTVQVGTLDIRAKLQTTTVSHITDSIFQCVDIHWNYSRGLSGVQYSFYSQ